MKKYNNETEVVNKYITPVLVNIINEINDNFEYNYEVPVKVHIGRETKSKLADIVFSLKDKNIIVIDGKSPVEKLQNHFNQIDSYASFLEAPLSILCNGDRIIVRTYLAGNIKDILLDQTVIEAEKEEYSKFKKIISQQIKNEDTITKKLNILSKDEVKKKNDYRKTFRKIHSLIRSIDKLDPTASFDEFSKILFIQIINDVKLNDDQKLTVKLIESLGSENQKRNHINTWFADAVEKYYPEIFGNDTTINLSVPATIKILRIMSDELDLKDSNTDIKGKAFEEFLPSQLRGKGLGQFFTPRPIVDFIIDVANINYNDKILDFAAGSGGFLIKAFEEKQYKLKRIEEKFPGTLTANKTIDELNEDIKSDIYGIDAEPRAARTAKMNMLLWGDGNQIQHGNGLDTKDYSGALYRAVEYNSNDKNSGVDIIMANPPFGNTEENQDILKKYDLSKNVTAKEGKIIKSKEKTEKLFIEKAAKMLKPNGKLLIVLPEGIFSNNKDQNVRDFILQNFTIEHIVKLPKHTFNMSGVDTINSVILIAKKHSDEFLKNLKKSDPKTWFEGENFTINFSSVNNIGLEPSGKLIYSNNDNTAYENSDLKVLAEKIKTNNFKNTINNPFEYAELVHGSDERKSKWKEKNIKFLTKEFHDIPNRLDPSYFFFKEESVDILKDYIKIPNLKIVRNNKLTEEDINTYIEKEETFNYLEVNNCYTGLANSYEEKSPDQLLAIKQKNKAQKLEIGDIVFNPYRINVGSVLYIDKKIDNLVTSPAYIVFRTSMEPNILVQMMKQPFMKYQIQILSSGSIRDNFSPDKLKMLKIPKFTESQVEALQTKIDDIIKNLQELQKEQTKQFHNLNNLLK